MQQVSDRLNRLTESATIAMARKSRELKAQGRDIISLSLGEPDFNTPDFIKEAAKKGIDQKYIKSSISKIIENEADPDFFSAIKLCKRRRIGPVREEGNRPLFFKKDIFKIGF